MFIRVTGDPRMMLPVLRREVATVDPEVPISEEMALADMIENYFIPVQLATAGLSFASGLALLLRRNRSIRCARIRSRPARA